MPPADVRNPVPRRLARVVEADFADAPMLGIPSSGEVFVATAPDIAEIDHTHTLARRLTLLDEGGGIPRLRPAVQQNGA